ncbi:MAG: hypothetical protein FWE91_10895 [Defluviitaleaceae bacterium]|nr:hypothetical protein [Defluviitaleaceae bacterium]MCL2835181.1 hypothetical protein [Defluviitaleaceae bacterium]
MLLTIMREVRNMFWDGYCVNGEIVVKDGKIKLSEDFQSGDYVYLAGVDRNSVYILHKDYKSDEESYFTLNKTVNRIYTSAFRLNIPIDFLELVTEIEEFGKRSPKGNILSEQFGEYRYTVEKGRGSWETEFAKSLNRYRKMSDPLLHVF